MEQLMKFLSFHATGLARMFYVANPYDHMFPGDDLKQIPDYITASRDYFFIFIVIEVIMIRFRKPQKMQLADSITSILTGYVMKVLTVFIRGFHVASYVWLYSKINIVQLQWDSAWTWVICFLVNDLFYYLYHRAAHEINFFWSHHVVHHSSQFYNLTTALRQSVLQGYFSFFFFLPAALWVHPVAIFVHGQFNTLYQFWIHTEMIPKLGWLEYIINTPSHHRVHHGSNRYCIDKNYGGTLIIWDRLFGTFAVEDDNEEVVYGLTHNINTYDQWTIQIHHLTYIFKRMWEIDGVGSKVKVLLYGPGWDVGKPRLGNIEDIPDVHAPVVPYRRRLPLSMTIYVVVVGLVAIVFADPLLSFTVTLPLYMLAVTFIFVFSQFYAVGIILDHTKSARLIQLIMMPLMTILAFYCYSTGHTFFYELLNLAHQQQQQDGQIDVNIVFLVVFGLLSLATLVVGPWKSIPKNNNNNDTKAVQDTNSSNTKTKVQ